MAYDVVIIGAGMSGLAAGIRLAMFDRRVLILDRHYLWGGLNSFYRRGGYRFDVGLHALTNFVKAGTKGAPLTKLLRQLRLKHEEFDLHEQRYSEVAFPGVTLKFKNDSELLRSQVREKFPAEKNRFDSLVEKIRNYNELDLKAPEFSAREELANVIQDPLLTDMLLCPLLFYGSARENDMDFGQFVVMFKSIFMEGFARPERGVRTVLEALRGKYLGLGGGLRMKSGVKEIKVKNGKAFAVLLDSGEEIEAGQILSSAGYLETLNLCPEPKPKTDHAQEGQLTFTESIFVLDKEPKELGFDATILFYNNRDRFEYAPPKEQAVNVRSAVVCSPNNYQYENPQDQKLIRVTHLARYDAWRDLPEEKYKEQKEFWIQESLNEVTRHIPDFRKHIVFTDSFTPKTIQHYTGHINGAVYGSPRKHKLGKTHLDNLFIMGTDQGFLGIVGAMLSGISMANMHCLQGKE